MSTRRVREATSMLRLARRAAPPQPALAPLRQVRGFAASTTTTPLNASCAGKNVAVVGGGLTGLTTAYYLAKRLPPSARVTLYEGSDRLGGWVRTDRVPVDVNGVRGVVTFERGPRTLSSLYGNTWRYDDLVLYDLMLDLGITATYPKDLPRYLYYPDHLVKMPPAASPWDCASEPLFRECVRGALGGLAAWVLRTYRSDRGPPEDDQSVAEWLRMITYGDDAVADNLASAMLHGIYGGDVERLSARSVLAQMYYGYHLPRPADPRRRNMPYHEAAFERDMARDPLVSKLAREPKGSLIHFGAQGMECLPKALENALAGQDNVTIRRNSPVTGITSQKGMNKIQVCSKGKWQLYDDVVCTTSSQDLVAATGTALSALWHINSVSIMTVNLWYPIENMKPRGFGYLIPRSVPAAQNPERALGVFFDSDVVAQRAADEPPGTKLFVLMGGHHYDPESGRAAAPPPSEEEAVRQAKAVVERHLGIPASTPCHAMARLARDCIPQHETGHHAVLMRAQEQLDAEFGRRLILASGSYGRVGALGALRNGYSAAASVLQDAETRHPGLEEFWNPLFTTQSLDDIPSRQIKRWK